MYVSEQILQRHQDIKFPGFTPFLLKDRPMIQSYIDAFAPMSCEYSFSNLFSWQRVYDISWTIYQEHLLIYDGVSNCSMMPLGPDMSPDELAILSLNLKNQGFSPDFTLATPEYIEKFPKLEQYYTFKKNPANAEYIYDVEKLSRLSGKKLRKKRNLIAQFKRLYPDYIVQLISRNIINDLLLFAEDLKKRNLTASKTLDHEMDAMKMAFDNFEDLGLEGVVILNAQKIAAFSVFSKLSGSCYDIHFEKADINYKGAGQIINQETAKVLQGSCQYVNREQDLGIKGLRKAKMSYDPCQLFQPVELIFTSSD